VRTVKRKSDCGFRCATKFGDLAALNSNQVEALKEIEKGSIGPKMRRGRPTLKLSTTINERKNALARTPFTPEKSSPTNWKIPGFQRRNSPTLSTCHRTGFIN
jgi:hypothetical protein